MAIKQLTAIKLMEKISAGHIILASLSEITGGWLALATTAAGKTLLCVSNKECPAGALWKAERVVEEDGLQIAVLALTPNNAAVVRRFVKWTAPSACGAKGLSLGFSDWLGLAGASVVTLFANKQIKPVLVEYTTADSQLVGRNFLEAVDAATWGVLEAGYKEGYGANAAGLTSEEEIVKGLLYGYSMIGYDSSHKINLEIATLSDLAVETRYLALPEEFRTAIYDSYLKAPTVVGSETLHYTQENISRIVLEYGEAIMHTQFIYNSYLKNTPWDIDFELLVAKPGCLLTPEEHYFIGHELTRNGIKLTAMALNMAASKEPLAQLKVHSAIAEACNYRLSLMQAEVLAADLGPVVKNIKGRGYLKMGSVLWLAALACIAQVAPQLWQQIAQVAELEPVEATALTPLTPEGRAYAAVYGRVLAPEQQELKAQISTVLLEQEQLYQENIAKTVKNYLKNV
ncbi:MAG: tagaturonate epimerase family protein [Acidaminococcaceae bacterium]